jgi:1-acyl-sn-glycerol-3-phosphate acyltransferase
LRGIELKLLRPVLRGVKLFAVLLAMTLDCVRRQPRAGVEAAVWAHEWSGRIVKALGLECSVSGRLPESGAVVSNHLSYLDILVYLSVRPFVMVAKSEVKGWPLLGWITARAGTVYVQRGGGPSTHDAVNRAMAAAYRTGLPVLFFPEGTTTDGQSGVLPFRRGLFHSVLNEGVSLQTAAVQYALEMHPGNGDATVSRDVCWCGDAYLGPHVLGLLGLRGVRAEIRFGDEVRERADRFVLSEEARAAVVRMCEGVPEQECVGELVGV